MEFHTLVKYKVFLVDLQSHGVAAEEIQLGCPLDNLRQYMLYYNILNESMIILDHGNICVDTIFMILSCIILQILKNFGFSIMAVFICIHIWVIVRLSYKLAFRNFKFLNWSNFIFF